MISRHALLDVLVHGQDISVPLGIGREMPAAAAVAAFERVWSMGRPFHARRRCAGVRLVATDADVAVGAGPVVEAALRDLLLTAGPVSAAAPRRRGPRAGLLSQ